MSKHAVPMTRRARLADAARATWRKWAIAAVAAAVAAMVGPGLVANAATTLGVGVVHNKNIAYHAVTDSKVNNNGVGWPKLSTYTRDRINTAYNNSQGTAKIVAVTAQTAITGRPDGGHGTAVWATDTMTRTLAIQRHAQVDVSHCGGSEADQCWFYTATVSDVGAFVTTKDATSPNDGKPISGTVTGPINGVGAFEFYSTDGTPNANLVPKTEDDSNGVLNGSASWPKLAFAKASDISGLTEHKYSYTYGPTADCESWVDASNNNDGQDDSAGDITGTNHCI